MECIVTLNKPQIQYEAEFTNFPYISISFTNLCTTTYFLWLYIYSYCHSPMEWMLENYEKKTEALVVRDERRRTHTQLYSNWTFRALFCEMFYLYVLLYTLFIPIAIYMFTFECKLNAQKAPQPNLHKKAFTNAFLCVTWPRTQI